MIYVIVGGAAVIVGYWLWMTFPRKTALKKEEIVTNPRLSAPLALAPTPRKRRNIMEELEGARALNADGSFVTDQQVNDALFGPDEDDGSPVAGLVLLQSAVAAEPTHVAHSTHFEHHIEHSTHFDPPSDTSSFDSGSTSDSSGSDGGSSGGD